MQAASSSARPTHLVDGESTGISYATFAAKLRYALLAGKPIDTEWSKAMEPSADRRCSIAFSSHAVDSPAAADRVTKFDIPPWAWSKTAREWRAARPAVLEAARRNGYVRDAIREHLEHNPGAQYSTGNQFARTEFLVRYSPAAILEFVGNDGLRLLETFLVAVRLREACQPLLELYYDRTITQVDRRDWCNIDIGSRGERLRIYTTLTPRTTPDVAALAEKINKTAAESGYVQGVLRSDANCRLVVQWLAWPGVDADALAAAICTGKREADENDDVSRKMMRVGDD